MKKNIFLITIAILLLIYIAYESYEHNRINKLNAKVSTLEEVEAQIDAIKIDTSLPEFKEHIIISSDSVLFNKQEGENAYKDLIKILRQKKIIGNNKNDSQSIELDSYDATDSCYVFCVVSLTINEGQGSSILGWWHYFPKTRKVLNGITFEELN